MYAPKHFYDSSYERVHKLSELENIFVWTAGYLNSLLRQVVHKM